MWKRLNFSNRTRENLSDNPSPPPEDDFKSRPYEIPSLDFHSSPNPPFAKHAKHPSEVPTVAASSVYSQPTYWADGETGISPPDSPRHSTEHYDDGRVSPVAEEGNGSRYFTRQTKAASSIYSSHIPIPRKPSAGVQSATTSSIVRTTPGNPYYVPTGVENIPTISPGEASKRGIFGAKTTNLASRLAQQRAPWKGASGRATIVDPVQDTPQAQKIPIPARNPNRPSPANTPTKEADYSTGLEFTTAQHHFQNRDESPDRLEHEDTLAALTARRKSDVDDKDPLASRFSWSTHATGTTHRSTKSRDTIEPPSPPPPMPTNMPSILRKSVATPSDSPLSKKPTFEVQAPKDESVLERRRPIPKDDVPTTPKIDGSPGFARSRMSTIRKPVGGGTPTGLSISAKAPGDTTSILSKSSTTSPKDKDLPLAPSILSSTNATPTDHVDILRSQMDDLAHRRQNIQRAIHNLTKAQSENQNPMKTDWRAARESERRIQGLRDELADINREDHELGLKLHRAYKRREREGVMAGTSALWVRRVTG